MYPTNNIYFNEQDSTEALGSRISRTDDSVWSNTVPAFRHESPRHLLERRLILADFPQDETSQHPDSRERLERRPRHG